MTTLTDRDRSAANTARLLAGVQLAGVALGFGWRLVAASEREWITTGVTLLTVLSIGLDLFEVVLLWTFSMQRHERPGDEAALLAAATASVALLLTVTDWGMGFFGRIDAGVSLVLQTFGGLVVLIAMIALWRAFARASAGLDPRLGVVFIAGRVALFAWTAVASLDWGVPSAKSLGPSVQWASAGVSWALTGLLAWLAWRFAREVEAGAGATSDRARLD